MKSTQIPQRVIDRARTRVARRTSMGCIESAYSVGSPGYPQIGWVQDGERHMTLVHRVIWIAARGPIEPGMTVDHMCKNRRCINIEHLRLLTNFENARRTRGRDWAIGTCINGHPNTELVIRRNGVRECGPCALDRRARENEKDRIERRLRGLVQPPKPWPCRESFLEEARGRTFWKCSCGAYGYAPTVAEAGNAHWRHVKEKRAAS